MRTNPAFIAYLPSNRFALLGTLKGSHLRGLKKASIVADQKKQASPTMFAQDEGSIILDTDTGVAVEMCEFSPLRALLVRRFQEDEQTWTGFGLENATMIDSQDMERSNPRQYRDFLGKEIEQVTVLQLPGRTTETLVDAGLRLDFSHGEHLIFSQSLTRRNRGIKVIQEDEIADKWHDKIISLPVDSPGQIGLPESITPFLADEFPPNASDLARSVFYHPYRDEIRTLNPELGLSAATISDLRSLRDILIESRLEIPDLQLRIHNDSVRLPMSTDFVRQDQRGVATRILDVLLGEKRSR
jgi:hypothetical protein